MPTYHRLGEVPRERPAAFRKEGDGIHDEELVGNKGILGGGDGPGRCLLQIFVKESSGLYDESEAGPFFYEIIQRRGDQGFGAGSFRALFESIERAQMERARTENGRRDPAAGNEVCFGLDVAPAGGRRINWMPYQPETPFDSIEGALEYVSLLAESVEEAREDIAAEFVEARGEPDARRRADALQLVAYKLERLAEHARSSRRLLNDLRTLRRLLLDERHPGSAAVTAAEPEIETELDG